MRNSFFICTVAVAYLSNSILAVQAAAGVEFPGVEALDNEIIRQELDLMILTTRLKMQMLPRSAWVGRRWFAYQLANTSLTAFGAFLSGTGRFSYLHKSRIAHAPKDLFEHATWYRVGANMDMVAGSVVEGALSELAGVHDRRRGLDLPSMQRYFSGMRAKLRRLLFDLCRSLRAVQADFLDLAYGAGCTIASLDLIRNQLGNELNTVRARRAQRLPVQVLSGQLKQLEMLESKQKLAGQPQTTY